MRKSVLIKGQHNPQLRFKQTKLIYKNGIKLKTNAEIILLIENVKLTKNNKVIIPACWKNRIAEEISRLITIQGKEVLENFEAVNEKTIRQFKRNRTGLRKPNKT